MKRKIKRIICSFLCLLLIFSNTSKVFAGYDDGEECPFCGHYHWDDYRCEGCGGCSDSCTTEDCHWVSHCRDCGVCLAYSEGCMVSILCLDCIEGNGFHCTSCEVCDCENEGQTLCGDCFDVSFVLGVFVKNVVSVLIAGNIAKDVKGVSLILAIVRMVANIARNVVSFVKSVVSVLSILKKKMEKNLVMTVDFVKIAV